MLIIFFFLLSGSLTVSATDIDDAIIRRDLNFTEMVKFDRYNSETHNVTTKDGYNLTLFRVPSNSTVNKDLEPMMYMHGLFTSGDDCIIPGPNRSHCYIYASAGRDVWIPNSRGTVYSRNHISLDPDKDPEYWNYTFAEMAEYDMSACIDYILETTGKKQIVFIGHGQGVTQLLLLCAAKWEYNAKVKAGFAMSVTAWMDHCQFVVMKVDGLLSTLVTLPIEAGLNAEFLPRGGPYQPILKSLCGTSPDSYKTCSELFFSLFGYNNYQISNDTLRVLTGHIPSGTSVKNNNYWGQLVMDKGFTYYNHGTLGNYKAYGQATPPEYDLSNVTMKWFIIASKGDVVSNLVDANTLASKLKNVTLCVLSDVLFGHLDFLFGNDLIKFITSPILKYLETEIFECV